MDGSTIMRNLEEQIFGIRASCVIPPLNTLDIAPKMPLLNGRKIVLHAKKYNTITAKKGVSQKNFTKSVIVYHIVNIP